MKYAPAKDEKMSLPVFFRRFNRKSCGRIAGNFFCAVFFCSSVVSASSGKGLTSEEQQWVDANPVIYAGVSRDSYVPYEKYAVAGSQRGLGKDFLDEMARSLGIGLEIVVYESNKQLNQDLESGKVHLMMAKPYTGFLHRSPYLTNAYLTLNPMLILGESVEWSGDLAGLRVAVPEGSVRIGYLEQYYQGASMLMADSNVDAINMVAEGRADAYISSEESVADEISESLAPEELRIGPKLKTPPISIHYMVSSSHPELVNIINQAFVNIGQQKRSEIINQWVEVENKIGSAVLSEKEESIIRKHAHTRIDTEFDGFPLSYEDGSGDLRGFNINVSSLIFESMNVPFEASHVGSLSQGMERIKSGQSDLFLGNIVRGGYPEGVVVSQPLVSFPVMVATGKDSPTISELRDLDGLLVAVDMKEDWFFRLRQRAPGMLTHDEPSLMKALSKLDEGKVDAVVANQVLLDAFIRGHYFGKIKIASATAEIEDLVFIAREEDRSFINLIDRRLATLPRGDLEKVKRSLASGVYVDVHKVDWVHVVAWASIPFVILFSIIIGLSISRRRLRVEVARRELMEQRLQDVARNLPAVIYKLKMDVHGNLSMPLIIGNAKNILGIDKVSFEENPMSIFRTLGMAESVSLEEMLRTSARDMSPIWHEGDFADASGEARRVATYLLPRKLKGGDVHWNGYWVDITTQYMQSRVLEEEKEKAERAQKSMSSFLAAISHEVRTPMSSIIGTLELLDRGKLDSSQRRLLSLVSDASESLLQILDDVLDFFKLDEDKMAVQTGPTNLRKLVEVTMGVLSSRVHGKGVSLRVFFDEYLADIHRADGLRIRQVLFNLVSNATKFTDSGVIEVSLNVVNESADLQRVCLRVSDTGSGIKEEKKKYLFVPFVQLGDVESRYLGGTGLGLSICRKIVDLMGGSINLESEVNVGTVVSVEFPLQVLRREPVGFPLSGINAYIKLNERSLQRSLVSILKYYGANIQDHEGDADIVFLNDGEAVDSDAKEVHVTSMPYHAGYPDRPLISSNPFRLQDVIEVSAKELGLHLDMEADTRVQIPVAEAGVIGKRVLVVEDDALMRTVLDEQLSRIGVQYDMVGEARQALERLSQVRYDLLLTDCHMPDMDGFELTRRVRSLERSNNLPQMITLGMTANLMEGQKEHCLDVGMNDLLPKPVRINKLREVLTHWLGSPEDAELPVPAPFDLDSMLEVFSDEVVARKILCRLLDEEKKTLSSLNEALRNDDSKLCASLVHRCLGGLRMMGDSALLDQALAIDKKHQNGEPNDIGSIGDFAAAFSVYLQALERWLDSVSDESTP